MNQMQRAGASNTTSIEETLEAIASPIQSEWDYCEVTARVASGAAEGEIETIEYKTGGSGGTLVATLGLTYDSNGDFESLTAT